jgi:hypothetical protein
MPSQAAAAKINATTENVMALTTADDNALSL